MALRPETESLIEALERATRAIRRIREDLEGGGPQHPKGAPTVPARHHLRLVTERHDAASERRAS